MPDLPARADLDQLRRQAKDLLRAARRADETAVRSLAAVAGSDDSGDRAAGRRA